MSVNEVCFEPSYRAADPLVSCKINHQSSFIGVGDCSSSLVSWLVGTYLVEKILTHFNF